MNGDHGTLNTGAAVLPIPQGTVRPLPRCSVYQSRGENNRKSWAGSGSLINYSSLLIHLVFYLWPVSWVKPLVFWGRGLPHHVACGISGPWPGMESMPPAVGGQSLNRTSREIPGLCLFLWMIYKLNCMLLILNDLARVNMSCKAKYRFT